ncbi:MAG: DNA translocase FtsK 4TM domain-containing protein, partial [Oscillospiraceae bacterium]|nr:DNA translocase FtsK 4TM domain-containing protein [Oscillospiraceae bacterium]
MAQARKSRSTSGAKPAAASGKPPRRREIAAVICLALGIFSFIGYFDAEPIFIGFFTGFVKRLIGYGYFVLPPALIMSSVILAFHKGYPILLRTICTLSLTVIAGAIVHLFAIADDRYNLSFSMISELWTDGAALESGGILGGSLSELFLMLFGTVGAAITLLIVAAVLVMIAFNATLSGLIEA